jgi:Skp family chaperone for outer membrane proteins
VRKIILAAAIVALVTGFTFKTSNAFAQNQQKEIPHKVGLIDMADIFKNYKKFEAMRETLKLDIEKSGVTSKKMLEELKALNEKMKSKNFTSDSPEKKKWRKDLILLTTQYQAYQKTQQAEFLDQESKIYKIVYLEVTDAVREYAKYYNYTLILRYNKQGVREAKNPKDVLSRMNRLVVYVRPGEDITEPVLRYLNQKFEPNKVGRK